MSGKIYRYKTNVKGLSLQLKISCRGVDDYTWIVTTSDFRKWWDVYYDDPHGRCDFEGDVLPYCARQWGINEKELVVFEVDDDDGADEFDAAFIASRLGHLHKEAV